MKKIMIIDDTYIANFILKKMINKVLPGCEVLDFTSPEDAINSLKDNNPDLIFLDLNMPSISGWKFLDLMSENNLENKVYILTSSTSEFDIQQSKQYKNVISYLVKPVNKSNLSDLLSAFG